MNRQQMTLYAIVSNTTIDEKSELRISQKRSQMFDNRTKPFNYLFSTFTPRFTYHF